MSHSHPPKRIGIIGAGGISRLHLEGLARYPERAQVVALCDPDEGTLQERAAEWGIQSTYADLERMVGQEDLDAAVVCTPTHVRSQVVLPLIEAGIPVFCEKPFAETYGEAADMEAAAREAGVLVAIDQNFRRHFSFHLARDILAGGALGQPMHLVQTVLGLRRDRGWRLDRRRYIMAIMSIHWFDGYRYMLREEPVSVYCRGVNSPATPGGEDTAISALLQFRKGGIACLSESFGSSSPFHACSLDCALGKLVLDYAGLTRIVPGAAPVEVANSFDKAEAAWYLLDDLLAAVEQGRQPETSAADNLHSMRIMEAAYRSLVEDRAVYLEEIR